MLNTLFQQFVFVFLRIFVLNTVYSNVIHLCMDLNERLESIICIWDIPWPVSTVSVFSVWNTTVKTHVACADTETFLFLSSSINLCDFRSFKGCAHYLSRQLFRDFQLVRSVHVRWVHILHRFLRYMYFKILVELKLFCVFLLQEFIVLWGENATLLSFKNKSAYHFHRRRIIDAFHY